MRKLSIIGLLLAANLLDAQTYLPRASFGAKLEPQGAIVHGAGQSLPDFTHYWNTMPVGRQPQVYMWYLSLSDLAPNWADAFKTQLQCFPGAFVLPQIGLNMGNSTSHYDAQVAAGAYDTQIGYLVSGLRKLATPAYIRIGYEFNGGWNGYQPATYIQAFTRITNALRAANDIEVATVWDAALKVGTNFMDYYPGDSIVDWFGVNIFDADSFGASDLAAFLSLARSHKKPVMLGELTPVGIGAQGGATSWNGWYALLFNFLAQTPEVKEFSYINTDWTVSPDLPTWGDSRLETTPAAYVRDHFVAQLGNPIFLNDVSESSFRKLLGYNDTVPPPAVSDLKVSAGSTGVVLTWTPVTDPSGIARYYLYRNGTLLDYAPGSPYTDVGAALGTYTYTIAAMDRAGNMSALSAPQSVTLTQVQRLTNGDFENGTTGWSVENDNTAGAAAALTADSTNQIGGTASGKLTVTKSDGTDWHLQLEQFFNITSGLTYTLSFKARASASVTLTVAIQQNGGSYSVYFSNQFTATQTATSFQYSFTAKASQPVKLTYYVGNIGSTTLWLDDVSVLESLGGANSPPNLLGTGVTNGASFLPAIAPGGWVTIKGANLSPVASDTWDKTIVNGKLPTSLDGVSVSIGGQPAYVYYVSPSQINVLAPQIPAGQTTLNVSGPAGATAPVTVNVASQAPAFFLWPENQAVATRQDGSYAVKSGTFAGATTAAAHPGDVIVLWGTGFGATTPAAAPGIVTPNDRLYNCDPVTATLGGTAVTVYGCALSPGWAGLYQVAIQVPTSLAAGDYALRVSVDNSTSPDGVILSVAP